MNSMKLKSLKVEGFKSIESMDKPIEFGEITILIGANGAGKSNFISFFTMLNFLCSQSLQDYIGKQGFAESLLFNGAKQTESIKAEIQFIDSDIKKDKYSFRLTYNREGTLFFADEYLEYSNSESDKPQEISLPIGQPESGLKSDMEHGGKTSEVIYYSLSRLRVYQFHDTSETAYIRGRAYINDNTYLRHNAGNLAAYLYLLKKKAEWRNYYNRIISHIQRIYPQFDNFILEPEELNNQYLRLDYKEKDNDYRFGPHQLSDGTIRFMALATLLLQPPDKMPSTIILDEPELGLHPAAITDFADMVKIASKHCQIILATQSTRLLDEFQPENVIIVERGKNTKSTIFKKLNTSELSEWLKEYSLSELLEKNVIGGQP